jgi:hypothetical protein
VKENSIEEDIKKVENYLANSAINDTNSNFFKNGGWETVDLEIPEAMQHILTNYKRVLKDNKLRDKTIELMAEYIESKNLLIDKNFHILTAESIKECFKNKAKKE